MDSELKHTPAERASAQKATAIQVRSGQLKKALKRWKDNEELRYRCVLSGSILLGIILAMFGRSCPDFVGQTPILSTLLCSEWIGKIPDAPVELLHKIGDAFIIAPLLAFLVDAFVKQKLVKEFSLDVSAYIAGRYLPNTLKDHLRDYLEMALVRTNWEITYTIEKWIDKNNQPVEGFIKLITDSAIEMQNYSHKTLDYDFSFIVEESLYSEIGNAEITYVDWPHARDDSRANLGKLVPENSYLRFPAGGKEILVPLKPYEKEDQTPHKFRAKSIECFRDSGYSSFFATYPVMSATLTVVYDRTAFKLSIERTYDDTKLERDDSVAGQTTWEITGPILPGQGFIARWDAIKTAPPPPAIDASLASN